MTAYFDKPRKALPYSLRNTDNKGHNNNNNLMYSSLPFIDQELTTWPANTSIRISVLLQIMFCSCSMKLRSCMKIAVRFPAAGREWFDIFSGEKEWWSNGKTIIELSYHKISWFASVSQINNYLPQPLALAKNWSAGHWQYFTIFCSTSSNNCELFVTSWLCLSRR